MQPMVAEMPEIRAFGKWSCEDVNVADMSLQVNQETGKPRDKGVNFSFVLASSPMPLFLQALPCPI